MEKSVNIVAEHNVNAPVWRTKNGDVKMSDMSDKYLQNSYYSAQRSHKKYHDQNTLGMCRFFENIMNQLQSEAKNRNVQLRCLSEINAEFINVLAKKAITHVSI
jgi:hypothetical protein